MKLLSIGKWHVCRLTFSLCIKDITYMYVGNKYTRNRSLI